MSAFGLGDNHAPPFSKPEVVAPRLKDKSYKFGDRRKYAELRETVAKKRAAEAARKKADQEADKSVRTYKPMSTFAKVGIGVGLGFIVALLISRKGK